MNVITFDAETYFDTKYSLRGKYNTSEYIRDPKFKLQCFSIKINDEPVQWFDGKHAEVLQSLPWNTHALLCHNTAFDGLILSHHYGIVPMYYLDTLSMARAVHGNTIKAGLDAVARHYGVGNKLPQALDLSKGERELSPEVLRKLGEYCAVDTELTYKIFQLMLPAMPQSELDLIDLTLRMFCTPVLQVDLARAQAALAKELEQRAELVNSVRPYLVLDKKDTAEKILRSRPKFAAALEAQGVSVPMKKSKSTGRLTFAFAKDDLEFQALAEADNQVVAALVAARMSVTSTLEETRAMRLIKAGDHGLGLPVLLKYYGAHTGRWSGGNKLNLQNLTRSQYDPDTKEYIFGSAELRHSIIAPEGHQILACDSAQIEARVLAWLAEHGELLNLFAAGQDVYKHQAAGIYGKPVDSITKDERFIGKIVTLALGYGMGYEKFQDTLAKGTMGPPKNLSLPVCREIVGRYRIKNIAIPKLWERMETGLIALVENTSLGYKCLNFSGNMITLPNGLWLQYPNLTASYNRVQESYSDFCYYLPEDIDKKARGDWVKGKKLYGGLVTENVVQALARIIVADQMLEIAKRYRVVSMTHDEVICVVRDEEVKEAEQFMLDVMRTPPNWCADLPLNAEVESGRTYS